MAEDDSLDVFDIIAGGFDRIWKLHAFFVDHSREYISRGSWPILQDTPSGKRHDRVWLAARELMVDQTYHLKVLCTAGLEQNQAGVRVLDQRSHDNTGSTLSLWILVTGKASVAAT